MIRKNIFFLLAVIFLPLVMLAQPNYGEKPYEITLPGLNGDTLSLSSLTGKVVLLDFWASWCGPCRSANRDLVKLYKKHKENGFEIFGVSLDEEEKHWRKAVTKDKITWLQVIDPGGWQAKTVEKWQLMAIPTNYLIDQNGVVVGIDLMPAELDKALSQLLKK